MRVKNKKTRKSLIILSSFTAALLVTGGLVYAFREDIGLTQSSSDETNYSEPTEQERQGEDTSEQENPESVDEATPVNEPSETDSGDNTQTSANEVIVSSINQEGNTLAIRTIIQPLVSGGSCTLSLSKAGQNPVRQTSGVQSMPSYSTCEGFNVDVSDMEKGSWNVEITHSNNGENKTGRGTAVVR